MQEDLARYKARVDAIYYCPHHPLDGCSCRKPKPGLIFRAAEELGLDLNMITYKLKNHFTVITDKKVRIRPLNL